MSSPDLPAGLSKSICAISILAVASVLSAVGAAAQSNEEGAIPRTIEGRPDLQGVWATLVVTELELDQDIASVRVAPEDVEAVKEMLATPDDGVFDPDFALHGVTELSVINGEHRAALISMPASGLMPFTPFALERAEQNDEDFYNGHDDPEQRSTSERCIAGLVAAPIRLLPLVIPNQIVQTDDHLIIRNEDVDGARIISLFGEAPPPELTSIAGHSQGGWEGDTLVVRTTHLRDEFPYREAGSRSVQITGDSVVVERFTMLSPEEIHYSFTVEDPALYTEPWLAEYVMKRSDEHVWEYACHEANYSLPNILKGGRAQQARKPADASQ